MKQSVPRWQLTGFVFTGIMGTFLHFLFDMTSGNAIAALFSAVNESIWEHMKLLFYPIILFALIEYRFWGKENPNFWCIKCKGILLGLLLIPVLYYTYTGLLGTSVDWFNITIFYIAAAVVYWWETKRFQNNLACPLSPSVSIVLICAIVLLFTVMTFFPPKIPLFQDPLTGTYGFIA